jgi:hypothetical protein
MRKCRTHIVGDILWYKPACYMLLCARCEYNEVIGSWYMEPDKKHNRYVWSAKQWPSVRAAINALEAVQDFSYRSSSTKR